MFFVIRHNGIVLNTDYLKYIEPLKFEDLFYMETGSILKVLKDLYSPDELKAFGFHVSEYDYNFIPRTGSEKTMREQAKKNNGLFDVSNPRGYWNVKQYDTPRLSRLRWDEKTQTMQDDRLAFLPREKYSKVLIYKMHMVDSDSFCIRADEFDEFVFQCF